jgi:hypothetical protein
MEFDAILAEAAPARRERLDGPESAAATALYQQITAARPAAGARSGRRRLIVLPVAGVAAVAAAATALTLISGSGVTSGRGQAGVRHATLAAWTAASQPDGLVKVTIRELRDPQGLARVLRADGVPVNVQFIAHPFTGSTAVNALLPSSCRPPQMSDKASALLQAKITPGDRQAQQVGRHHDVFGRIQKRQPWCGALYPPVRHPAGHRVVYRGMGGTAGYTQRQPPRSASRPCPGQLAVHRLVTGSNERERQ